MPELGLREVILHVLSYLPKTYTPTGTHMPSLGHTHIWNGCVSKVTNYELESEVRFPVGAEISRHQVQCYLSAGRVTSLYVKL